MEADRDYYREADRTTASLERSSDVLLVIPAYNEADSIERVVDELVASYSQFDYIVVTDGSTDGTDMICRRRGYRAIHLPQNLGLTGSFHVGMQFASEAGYLYAVQFDGDGQHLPEYIAPLYEKALEGYDLVLGSRFIGLKNKMNGLRHLGSAMIRMAMHMKAGREVTDPTCGLRMYNKRIIDLFARRTDLAPEPNTIALLIRKGARVAEVPVRVAERTGGQSYLSPVNAARYMYRMLRSILFMHTR